MSAKCSVRKNEPFMKAMTRSHSAELLRDGVSLEQTLGLDCFLEPAETVSTYSFKERIVSSLYICGSYFKLGDFLYSEIIFVIFAIVDNFRLHQNACSNNSIR